MAYGKGLIVGITNTILILVILFTQGVSATGLYRLIDQMFFLGLICGVIAYNIVIAYLNFKLEYFLGILIGMAMAFIVWAEIMLATLNSTTTQQAYVFTFMFIILYLMLIALIGISGLMFEYESA